MSNRSRHRGATWWIALVALLLAAGWTLMYAFTLPQGDDLAYASVLRSADGAATGSYPVWAFPHYWARHWLHVNGRSANLLAALAMGLLPRWAVAAMGGAAVGAMCLLTVRLCGLLPARGRGLAAAAAMAVVACLLPWWDSFSLLDVNFNYVWATLLTMAVLLMLARRGDWLAGRARTVGTLLLCAVAGMCHEAASLPLCAGMLWVAYVRGGLSLAGWRRLSPTRRKVLGAFFVGAALAALSPGIVMRSLRERTPDDLWWVLILKSAPITLLLLLAMCVALTRRRWRRRLLRLLRGGWGLWAVSAVAGLALVVLGGIVGRSGWFSQVAALIALCRWLRPWRWLRVPRLAAGVAAVALGVAVVAQMVGVDVYSYRAWRVERDLRAQYAASADGIVCCDLPDDMALPFWAFSRVRVLRPEDDYTHYGLRMHYHKAQPLVNLPAAAAGIDWPTLRQWADPRDPELRIVAERPCGTLFPADPGWAGRYVGRRVGPGGEREWVIPFAKEGRTYYYIRPFRPRWGDRF